MPKLKLKPCPFCGAEGKIKHHIFQEMDDTFGVICGACEAQTSQFFVEIEDAIEAWNRRVDAVFYKDIVDASVTVPIYDLCEKHENCTVEVWKNSVTGEVSVGWYENKGGDDE